MGLGEIAQEECVNREVKQDQTDPKVPMQRDQDDEEESVRETEAEWQTQWERNSRVWCFGSQEKKDFL